MKIVKFFDEKIQTMVYQKTGSNID